MTIKIFKLVRSVSRSVYYAQCVREVLVNNLPQNLDEFAKRNGGHFAEVVQRKVVA